MRLRPTFVAAALALAAFSNAQSLYGIMFRTGGQTSGLNPKLYDINPATGVATNPRNVNVNDSVGLAISPNGTMYALTDQFGRINNVSGSGGKGLLVKVDPATGAATAVGRIDPSTTDSSAPLAIYEGDLAFDSQGTLWGVTTRVDYATLFTIDTATGLGTLKSNVFSPFGDRLDLSAMAFMPNGELWALDTRYPATGQGGPARLLKVDPTTGATLDSFVTETALGNCAGMAANPLTGELLVSDGDTYGTANLYRVNFGTKKLDLVGATGAAGGNYVGLAGLAYAPVPEPASALALGGLALMAIRRRKPRA